jgi:RNA polymerase sigma factor (sigma-70 family)
LPSEEAELLQQYVATRSEAAFRRLVERYLNLVYAAARRQVRDADLARDVTQAVFLVLAEKAAELRGDRPLSAWLLSVTRYAAANAVRARARRTHHEQRAAGMAVTTMQNQSNAEWQELSPLLDEGMGRLRSKDRDVLLLRFFEQKSAREVAEAMGISEDAAEKRIARAVAKLRDFFQRRGVAVTLVALTTTLAANCAEAAPLGLTTTIAASAASAATSSATTLSAASIAKGTVITMASVKAKTALLAAVAALLLVGSGTVAVKTFITSPSAQRVNVSSQAAATTSATAPAGLQLQFSQGTTVELLGISDAPQDSSRWWAADGTPIDAPSPLPRRIMTVSPGQQMYQFRLRKTDPAGEKIGMTVSLGGTRYNTAASLDERDGVQSHVFGLSAAPPAIIDVRVSLAFGPWSDVQQFDLNKSPGPATATAPAPAPTTNTAAAPNTVLTVSNVSEGKDGFTDVEIRFAPGASRNRMSLDEQLYLVTADGRQVFSQRWNGYPGGRSVLGFNVPRGQAVALHYRSRPYETREIRNVSLRPGTKTVVAFSNRLR